MLSKQQIIRANKVKELKLEYDYQLRLLARTLRYIKQAQKAVDEYTDDDIGVSRELYIFIQNFYQQKRSISLWLLYTSSIILAKIFLTGQVASVVMLIAFLLFLLEVLFNFSWVVYPSVDKPIKDDNCTYYFVKKASLEKFIKHLQKEKLKQDRQVQKLKTSFVLLSVTVEC